MLSCVTACFVPNDPYNAHPCLLRIWPLILGSFAVLRRVCKVLRDRLCVENPSQIQSPQVRSAPPLCNSSALVLTADAD